MELEFLQAMRNYYTSGATRSYEFRRRQLLQLRAAIYRHEKSLHDALWADLKKSPEESWVTETGFVAAEASHALRHLKKWMRPQKVRTNLINFPGSSYIYKESLGVVLVVAPWNYPVQLLLTPLVGAIAAGNVVVLKPSEFSPAAATALRRMIEDCFPADYVRIVEGAGVSVVPAMIEAFRFDHVFYTGSTQVGKMIYEMAARKLVPVTLELGGKSPCVVEEDANIQLAAKRIAVTKFSNAGQMCVAPDYVLVKRSRKDELVRALQQAILQFYTADAASSASYGKIINEKQFNRLKHYLGQGRIVHGGSTDASRLFIEPTIMEDIGAGASVMQEEIFGPILPVIAFDSLEEARQIISTHADPLAFYLFTQSRQKEKQWLDSVAFGGGCINNASWHLTNFNLPFGGRGNSGIGAYHGRYSFEIFSHRKAVMKTPAWFDPAIKYPPFSGKLNLFKKLVR